MLTFCSGIVKVIFVRYFYLIDSNYFPYILYVLQNGQVHCVSVDLRLHFNVKSAFPGLSTNYKDRTVIKVFSEVFVKVSTDCKVRGANMGPIWGRQDLGGPHVGPMNFAIRVSSCLCFVMVLLQRFPFIYLLEYLVLKLNVMLHTTATFRLKKLRLFLCNTEMQITWSNKKLNSSFITMIFVKPLTVNPVYHSLLLILTSKHFSLWPVAWFI